MKTRKTMAVALAASILASGGGIAVTTATAAPAYASTSQQEVEVAIARILADTNAERAKTGLAPLRLTPVMNTVAQNWTEQMALKKSMVHNPNYDTQLPPEWYRVGENVAQGYQPETVVQAWMNSEGHRRNIMGDFTHIGLGYTIDDTGRAWFTQNFGKYTLLNNPTPVSNPQNVIDKTTFTSRWQENNWKELVADYTAELYAPDGSLVQTKTVTTPEVAFDNLESSTQYTVKITVRAMDETGWEFFSPVTTYNVLTLEDLPTVTAPQLLTATSNDTSITAKWAAPASSHGQLQPYTVELKQGGTVVQTATTTNPTHTFQGLASNTNYNVTVTASTVIKGKSATAVTTLDKKTALSSVAKVSDPTNVKSSTNPDYSMNVTWGAPVEKIGIGLNYVITLESAGKPAVIVETTNTNYLFTGLQSDTTYTAKVQARIVSEDRANTAVSAGATTTAVTPENPADNLTEVTAPSIQNVDVKWNEASLRWTDSKTVTGKFVGYTVMVKEAGKTNQVFTTTNPYYTVSGLSENTRYTFEVVANGTSNNAKHKSSSSAASTTQTTPYSPSTAKVSDPQDVATKATAWNSVGVSWKAPSSFIGKVTGYEVTVMEGSTIVETKTVTGLTASFTGLKGKTGYTVVVNAVAVSPDGTNTAKSAGVRQAVTTPVQEVAPSAPTGLKTSDVAHNAATLSWNASTGFTGKLLDYTVTVKEAGKADRVFTTTSTNYKVTGLTGEVSYTMQVVANAQGTDGVKRSSAASNITVKTPNSPSMVKVSAPQSLLVKATAWNNINVSWKAPAAVIGKVTGYEVTVKEGSKVVQTKKVTGLDTTFSNLKGKTGYTVSVVAIASSTDGLRTLASSPVNQSVTTPVQEVAPSAPTGLKSSAVTHNEATVSWKAVTGFTGKLTGYTVTVKQAGKADRVFTTTGTSYKVSGLSENTAYTMQVVANAQGIDGVKRSSSATNLTVKTSYSPSTVKVSTAQNLTLKASAWNKLDVSWKAPATLIGKVTGYEVTVMEGNKKIETKTVTGLNTTFTNLKAKTGYTVTVSVIATSANGVTKAKSSVVRQTVTTPAKDVAPKAPTGLKSSAVSHDTATLSWKAATGFTGKLLNYTVTVKQAGKANRVFTTTGTSYKVTGLSENVSYTMQVVANAQGNDGAKRSSSAANITVKTPYSSNTVKVTAPSGLKASGVKYDTITYNWNAATATVGKLTGYTLTLKDSNNKVVKTATTSSKSYKFTGLKANTRYTVQLTANAISSNGLKKASSPIVTLTTQTHKSSEVAIGRPVIGVTQGAKFDRATIFWVAPPVIAGEITGYRLTVMDGKKTVKTYNYKSNVRYQELTGLKENTTYVLILEAMAVSPDGSKRTSTNTVTHFKTVFSPESVVKVGPFALTASATKNAVSSSWNKPVITGKLINYTVTLKQGNKTVKSYNTTTNKANFTSLKANTAYTVTVQANVESKNGKQRTNSKSVRHLNTKR